MARPPHRNLARAIADCEGVFTLAALCAADVPRGAADALIRAKQRSRRLLPGVYVAHLGPTSDRELDLAASRYAGSEALLRGARALRVHGLQSPPVGRERHVLIPAPGERQSVDFVIVEATTRLPVRATIDGIPIAPIARAALDFCRRAKDPGVVRAVLSEILRSRRATVAELWHELERGSRRGSKLARDALRGLHAGARSAAELEAHDRISASVVIPKPTYNQHLYDEDDNWVLCADTWWKGLVGQIQSKQHHFVLDRWEDDNGQATRLAAYNTLLLPIVPSRIYKDWPVLEKEISEAVTAAAENDCRLHPGPPPPWWGDRMG